MASAPAVIWFVLLISPAFAQPPLSKILARVSEEAEVLQQNAPKILTQETLAQRALMPPSRFRPRNESAAAGADSRLRIREIVSEYSFGALSEAPTHNLLEFRDGGRHRPDGLRLAPVGISASLSHEKYSLCLYSFDSE